MEPGDWVEGKPQWWWKYVFPARGDFWLGVIQRLGPSPDPWKEASADILEGLAMVHGIAAVGDPQIKERLHQEAVTKILRGANSLAGKTERQV